MSERDSSSFRVVDLISQAKAVSSHVQGWSSDRILKWLRAQGSLESDTTVLPEKQTYFFRSDIGREAVFWLDGDEFTFIGDNTTFRPE